MKATRLYDVPHVGRTRPRALGVADPDLEVERRVSRSLQLFKRRLLELVASKDWEAAIFAQNVILESVERLGFP